MGFGFSRKTQQKIILVFLSFLITPIYGEKKTYFSQYNSPPKYSKDSKNFEDVNPQAPKGGALKISVIGSFDGLNPFVVMGSSPPHVSLFCFARLFDESRDEVDVSYPYLAKNIDISDDRKTITYELQETATFSDHTPITAKDVVWSFNFLIKINPLMKTYYKDIEKVEDVNKHTVRFHSKNPQNKELPRILGQLSIFPSKFFQTHMTENGIIREPFPVSGPYKITTVDFGRTIVFERVKNWWGEKIPTNVGLYNFDTIELQYFRDRTAGFESFLAGNANVWIETSANKWHTPYDSDTIKNGKIIKKILPDNNHFATRAFAFNLRKVKFQDIRVRKAISILFNFESLNKTAFYSEYSRLNSYYGDQELAHKDALKGNELKLLQPHRDKVPSEVFGASFKNPVYLENIIPRETLKEALNLLKEAGWEIKDKKLTNKDGEIFEITFPYAEAQMEKVILHLQRNLEVAGINLRPRQVDTSTYVEMIDQFDFDIAMVIIGQSHTLGNEQREYFGSRSAHIKGSKNLAGIENPILDELIEKLIIAPDYQAMLDCAHAIDRVLCWNYYMILNWDFSGIRTAYWNVFAMPKKQAKYSSYPLIGWWEKKNHVADKKEGKNHGFIHDIIQKIKDWF